MKTKVKTKSNVSVIRKMDDDDNIFEVIIKDKDDNDEMSKKRIRIKVMKGGEGVLSEEIIEKFALTEEDLKDYKKMLEVNSKINKVYAMYELNLLFKIRDKHFDNFCRTLHKRNAERINKQKTKKKE